MNQLVIKKKNELREKKKKGFTLVELIIVIAVIAILATVAVPKFGTVKEDANLAVDQANAKIIATAVTQAVANGDVDVDDKDKDIYVDVDKIKAYIDGNELPIIKSESGKTFYATYSINGGTKVYVGSGGKKLYPLDKEIENDQSGNEPNLGENNTDDSGNQNK